MRIPIAALTALALTMAAPALACEREGKQERRQKKAELRVSSMQEADEDGDGALTPAEFEIFRAAFERRAAEARFVALDRDGDGLVTVEELSEGPRGPERRHH